MASKRTTLAVRISKPLKNYVEKRCEQEGTKVSDVTRDLLRDFARGKPSVRELLEENNSHYVNIMSKLSQIEV